MRYAIGIVVIIAALVAGCGGKSEPTEPQREVLTYHAVDAATGAPVSLTDLRGHPALLSSWATWCAPCRKELPELQSLYESRRSQGLRVVTVNVDAPGPGEAQIGPMAQKSGLTMPQWRDPEDRFTVLFAGRGVPTNVLLDADGRVLRTWYGAIDIRAADFIATIDAALSARAP